MEAAGENHIPFVVLDRPNPLGGMRVEGPSVEPGWISFVSQFPVPYVHGMTVGELAQMVNAKGWAGAHCDLTVVPMKGWSRDMIWGDTLLRWIPTSPKRSARQFVFWIRGNGDCWRTDRRRDRGRRICAIRNDLSKLAQCGEFYSLSHFVRDL